MLLQSDTRKLVMLPVKSKEEAIDSWLGWLPQLHEAGSFDGDDARPVATGFPWALSEFIDIVWGALNRCVTPGTL